MQSRLFVNLGLLLLVFALGYFVLTSENKDSTTPQILTDVKADSINTITIRHNNRVINIEKNNAHWHITSPVDIAANDFRIGTILNLLNTVSHSEYAADSLDLEKYSLAPAKTSITFNKLQIDFGMINPINNYRYVKINNRVHLIDDHHYPLLSSQAGTLVSRTLLPADAKINKLVLPDQTLSLNSKEIWRSTKEISADAIIETLSNWKNTEAFGVHDYNERESLGAIEVYLDNVYEPIRFFITDVDPWLVIARPDIKLEYHFNLEFYDALLRPGAEKTLPEEFSEQSERVSPEEFMKLMNK